MKGIKTEFIKIKINIENYKRGINYLQKLGYNLIPLSERRINDSISKDTSAILVGNNNDNKIYYCENNCDKCEWYCKSVKDDNLFSREEKLKRILK